MGPSSEDDQVLGTYLYGLFDHPRSIGHVAGVSWSARPGAAGSGRLLATLPQLPGQIVLVSNQVGQGIVPLDELTRRYVDDAGRLLQALAVQCERVVFVVAGLPMVLKGDAV